MDDLFDPTYEPVARWWTGAITFVLTWAGATLATGWLGFLIGWAPAAILALVAFLAAPLLWYGALLAFAALMVLLSQGS